MTTVIGWNTHCIKVEASWNVMAHAQKPNFVFRRNGQVHLNRRGHQFSRLLAAEVCASAFIVGSNAGYTMFRGSVKGTDDPLHSPVSPSLPLPCVTMCHHISTGVYWICVTDMFSVYNSASKLNIGITSVETISDGHVCKCAYIRGSKMLQFNQKKQHFPVKTFAPPVIKGEMFLKLTVTVRRWTTSLPSPSSPAWSASSKTHYPNTLKMEPSMSSHGIEKNLISGNINPLNTELNPICQ